MKCLMVTLAVALLAIGVAHAQSDATHVGAPLDLHPPVAPSHVSPVRTRTTPATVSIFDINPTAGPSQPAVHRAAVHATKAHKHKKPVVHEVVLRHPAKKPPPPVVHAKATHTKPAHVQLVQMRTPSPTMTYTKAPPATARHAKTKQLPHARTAPVKYANDKIPHAKTAQIHTVRTATVQAKLTHPVAMARPPARKPAHHAPVEVADRHSQHIDEFQNSDVLNDLSAHGYADFKNFHRVGSHYAATVNRDGRDIALTVDPRTHQVTASP